MTIDRLKAGMAGLGVAALLGAPVQAQLPCFEADPEGQWAFEFGVAFITESAIEELLLLSDAALARGPAGGEIYTFTAARRLGWLELGGFRPEIEVPLTLELVDENGRSPFLDLNTALVVRWTEFPWSDHLVTTFATGVGLSWSEEIYQIDLDRHPNQDRSHLKFHWPIELTFALPEFPQHQLRFFLSHQSGGHVFDEGGINSVGLGYRFVF